MRGEDLRLVDNAVESLFERSTHERIEVVVVVDANSTTELAARLRGG